MDPFAHSCYLLSTNCLGYTKDAGLRVIEENMWRCHIVNNQLPRRIGCTDFQYYSSHIHLMKNDWRLIRQCSCGLIWPPDSRFASFSRLLPTSREGLLRRKTHRKCSLFASGKRNVSSNISNTSASVWPGFPDTEKQIKARGRRRVLLLFRGVWKPPVKHDAPVFDMASKTIPTFLVLRGVLFRCLISHEGMYLYWKSHGLLVQFVINRYEWFWQFSKLHEPLGECNLRTFKITSTY